MGDPKPIDDGKVDRTAVESKLAGVRRSVFADLQIEAGAGGKAMTADHIQLPGERAGRWQTEAQGLAGQRWRRPNDEADRHDNSQHSRRFRATGLAAKHRDRG